MEEHGWAVEWGWEGVGSWGGATTHRHRIHGLDVAPEALSGLNEQAFNGCLL